jgi:hypothetical protein
VFLQRARKSPPAIGFILPLLCILFNKILDFEVFQALTTRGFDDSTAFVVPLLNGNILAEAAEKCSYSVLP